MYSHDEAKQLAQEMLDKCAVEMYEERTIYYESTAWFYGIEGHIITIKYNGGAFDYHAFSGDELISDAERGEIEKSLKALGIDVPEEAKFFNEGEGSYKFSVNKLLVDGCLYDGAIELTYTVNGSIETMYDNIIKYQPYKEFELISEREAYDKLLNGEFVCYYQDIFGDLNEKFLEDNGRCLFLLYIKPIINGTGNYYIEAKTRTNRRTDLIIDYCGEQHIVELKIWRGQEYNKRGEEQLTDYLDLYHAKQGYLVSFNFNKKKKTGVERLRIKDKIIFEAVV